MDLSVVVSTRNRADHLRRLVASLDRVVVRPAISWELVLVDNGSTDATAATVRELSAVVGFPLRYTHEPRQGKSHGLNTGIALAAGRILAFTDHDAIVPPEWVGRIVEFFDATPGCACVGGSIDLHDARDAHLSIRLSERRMVVDRSIFPSIPIIGCNMAIRAEVLRKVGEFDVDLCPGSRIGGAEDVDMLYRILRAGYVIHYEPQIHVSHNHGRRTATQVADVLRGYGAGMGAFYLKHILRGDRTVARWAYWDFFRSLRHPLRWKTAEGLRRGTWLLLGIVRYIRFGQRGREQE